VYHGASYARVYRPYTWGGVSFHVYTPYRYYRPAFYSYVYSPWARPVYYSWGWGASPWYGYYGGWFTPYPVYASPSLWLTDYLISRTLEDAYQARADAAAQAQAQNYGSTPMTPDVKQAIADEVRRQLDQEKADQANLQNTQGGGAPPLFSSNGPQVFVVSTALTVQSQSAIGMVTEGDVLQMNGPPQQGSQTANVMVLASKGQDCRKGSKRGSGAERSAGDAESDACHDRPGVRRSAVEAGTGRFADSASGSGRSSGQCVRQFGAAGFECIYRAYPGSTGSRSRGTGCGQPEPGQPGWAAPATISLGMTGE